MRNWLQEEFDEERDAIIRALTGMIFSYDQNGHLLMHRGDILELVAAVDLLRRSMLQQRSKGNV